MFHSCFISIRFHSKLILWRWSLFSYVFLSLLRIGPSQILFSFLLVIGSWNQIVLYIYSPYSIFGSVLYLTCYIILRDIQYLHFSLLVLLTFTSEFRRWQSDPFIVKFPLMILPKFHFLLLFAKCWFFNFIIFALFNMPDLSRRSF